VCLNCAVFSSHAVVNFVRPRVKPPTVYNPMSHHAHSSDKVSFFALSRTSRGGGGSDDVFLSEFVKIRSNATKRTVSSFASFTVTLFNKSSQCVHRLRIEKAVSISRGRCEVLVSQQGGALSVRGLDELLTIPRGKQTAC